MTRSTTIRAVSPTDDAAHDLDRDGFGLERIADLDAEGIVLGATFHGARLSLRAEQFYATAHQRIWEAVTTLLEHGKPTDPVAGVMRTRGTLKAAGGTPYLAETLALCQPSSAHPEAHAATVVELWKQRTLVEEMRRCAILMRGGEMSHEQAKGALREHFRSTK